MELDSLVKCFLIGLLAGLLLSLFFILFLWNPLLKRLRYLESEIKYLRGKVHDHIPSAKEMESLWEKQNALGEEIQKQSQNIRKMLTELDNTLEKKKMNDECNMCGEHALQCGCNGGIKFIDPFSGGFDPDPIFDPKTGEIYRKTKWISKEEAKEIFPL